jgi:PadR family transcriptional regulator PadR
VWDFEIKLSKQTLDILNAHLVQPVQWHHGYAISKHSGIALSTLYPILIRLEKLGRLETCWNETPEAGRPPRHEYRLTLDGRERPIEELRAARKSKFGKMAARVALG